MTLRDRVLSEGYDRIVRPRLFKVGGGNPEAAHEWTIEALARATAVPGLMDLGRLVVGAPHQPVTVAGIEFPGRVGLAAGVDKDGLAARGWEGLGFGFAELGTVTRYAQPGNPSPRMFRLRHSRAIVNRMGFNNAGAAALATRLEGWGVRRGERSLGIPLGISLGKSKRTPVEDATADYLASFYLLAPYADYVAVNVSSPNTPGLRTLQGKSELIDLIGALIRAAHDLDPERPVPIFVKLAPDLGDAQFDEAFSVCADQGAAGLIVCNTTLSREGLADTDVKWGDTPGGMSGAPLTARALECVRYATAHQDLPVIGVGGIMTPDDAARMFDAGAALVQLYSGFIYAGPALVAGINAL